MGFFSSLPAEHLKRYSRIIQEGIEVRSHSDLLNWLQGELQHYLPHEIMLATWGNFGSNSIRHDIVSPLPGVRTAQLEPIRLYPLLRTFYNRWVELGRLPYASGVQETPIGETCIAHSNNAFACAFGRALQGMRSSLLHGISDERGRHDCLYVIFSTQDKLDESALSAMEILLPYLDTALRRVAPLPPSFRVALEAEPSSGETYGLSERETEIMEWVGKGKTNAEIGNILCISSYTVKNHLHQIFRKLDVYNRVQAVSKIERRPSHG